MGYYSKENTGGPAGSKGYNFQDICTIRYLFEYIDDEQFENLTVEQINDFTVRLKTKEISVQVKGEHITKRKLSEIQKKINLVWTKEIIIIAPSWEKRIEKVIQKKKELINAKLTKRSKRQIDIIETQFRKVIEDAGIEVGFAQNCSFDNLAIKEQWEVVLYRIRKWLDKNFFECDENIILDRLISYVSRQREHRGFITKETLIEIVKSVGSTKQKKNEKQVSIQKDIILSNLKKEKTHIPAASMNIDIIVMNIEREDFERAYIYLKAVENDFGNDLSEFKIWILIILRRWKEAKEECDNIIRNKEVIYCQWIFLYKGIIAYETKKYNDAFKYLNKYVVKFGNKSFEAALYLAKTQIILNKNLEYAKELLIYCRDIYDSNSEVYFELYKLCPLHEAMKHLEKVVQLDENHMQARYKLAEGYRLMGLNREAYNSYKIYFKNGIHESNWRELSGYIYSLLNLGKREEAEAYIAFFVKAFIESKENRLKDHQSMVLMDLGKESIYLISCKKLNNCYYFETPIGQITIPVRNKTGSAFENNGVGVIPDWFLSMYENLKATAGEIEYDIEATWKPVFIINYENDFDFLVFKTYLLKNGIVVMNHDWLQIIENKELTTPYVGLEIGDELHYIEYNVKMAVDIHIFEYESRIQVDSQYLQMKSNSSFIKSDGYYNFKRILEQRNDFSWIIYSINRKEMIEIRIPKKYLRIEYC